MIGGEHVPFSTAREVINRVSPGVEIDDHRKTGGIFSNSQIQMHLTGKRLSVHLGKAPYLCTIGPRGRGHRMEGGARMSMGRASFPSRRIGGKLNWQT